MLLTSVILVLQEMLEAALIISVLLAFSVRFAISRAWVFFAIGGGIALAFIYASQVEFVSELFDYMGMEVVNATIQFVIAVTLVAFSLLFFIHAGSALPISLWQSIMTLIVTLAIAREGFEILLYVSGFLRPGASGFPALIGSVLGAGIGLSVGALLYYLLVSTTARGGRAILLVLLALFAGNMTSQGMLLLIQADFLPSSPPLWDTSALLPEESLAGRMLYALIGYEATPSPLQVVAYGIVAGSILLTFTIAAQRSRTSETAGSS